MTSISQPVSGVSTPSHPTTLLQPNASGSNPELAATKPNNNISSTFNSLTSSNWIPKEIPTTFKASLSAWISHSKTEGAEAELHLYKKTGYFNGATVSNAKNLDDFNAIYQSVATHNKEDETSARASLSSNLSREFSNLEEKEKKRKSSHHHHSSSSDWTEFATVGTSVNPKDGKVGIIRAVDLGKDPRSTSSSSSSFGSWFSKSEKRFINQLEIGLPSKGTKEETTRVLLHGYGAGTAFFFQNVGSLASIPSSKGSDVPTRLYCLDWLGMGRSARVKFEVPNSVVKQGTKERVETAEQFFIDSLEQWREKMGIKSMDIIAHSLGGYLSLSYASKYPERVDRLILVSPAGIPSNPDAIPGEDSPSPFASKQNRSSMDSQTSRKDVEQELRDVQESIAPSSKKEASDQASKLVKEARREEGGVSESKAREIERDTSTSKINGKVDENQKEPPRFSSRTRSVIGWLWEQNVSPFSILRGSLAFSPMLAGRYTSRRFGALPTEDLNALHAYCYSIFSAKGSSEYVLAHVLSVGAHARWPQVDRMQVLGKTNIPVYALYGSDDWMDLSGGKELVKKLKGFGNGNGATYVVPRAGHHLYLDNAKAFNKLVGELLTRPLPTSTSTT